MTAAMPGPIPAPPPDHERAVGQAMAALEGIEGRPLGEHVAAFERVHAALSDALAAGSAGAA